MRARWFILAWFFFINVVAALAASRWVGAAVCCLLAFCLLAMGFVDAAALHKDRMAPRDPAAVENAITALSELVALKNGPCDDAYQAAKPLAWQKGRDALSHLAGGRLSSEQGSRR